MNFNSLRIPREMKNMKNWVLYKKEYLDNPNHPSKVMISVSGRYWHKARSNQKEDWTIYYPTLRTLYKTQYDGLAFVLNQGIVFIDIDNSINEEGELSSLAKELLDKFPNTYAERSCSGKGIHIFLKGKLNESFMKRNDSIGLEIYDTKRFCCMTGDIISTTSELKDYQNELDQVCNKYLKREEKVISNTCSYSASLEDNQILDKAFKSKVGNKIARLYSGDISDYPSHSNADLAFMAFMAFYTRNPSQLDSIMRSSGLYRDKWDEKRGRETYGSITINQALRTVSDSYKPKRIDNEMY